LVSTSLHLAVPRKYRGYAIASCEIRLVFTVDGVERFRDSITIPLADFDAFTRHSNTDPRLERAAKAIGIPRWLLQTMIQLLNGYAEWEVKDSDASELFDCPHLHGQTVT
jgi:hypothetical protein